MVTDKLEKVIDKAKNDILAIAVQLVQETIDNYVNDLHSYMGLEAGETGYSDREVSWAPLDLESDQDSKFWYESGTTAGNIVSKVVVDGNKIYAMAGLPSESEGYKEALWNEFGWSPHGSSKIVRRALFVPLSEYHLRELNILLQERIGTIKMKIRIKL